MSVLQRNYIRKFKIAKARSGFHIPIGAFRRKVDYKNACYSVSITCSPAKNYPYRLEIMNCYAPLGHGRNGMLPILMDQAEDIRRESIDLTEGEWLYIMDCLDSNRKEAKAMWYAQLRNQDEKNRWNGNGG